MRTPRNIFSNVQENINQELYEAALKELEKCYKEVTSKFDESKFYVLKARCLLKLNRFNECFTVIEKGIKLSPDYPALLFEKANYYFVVRNYKVAQSIYIKLIEINPNMLKNWLGYINCFIKEKRYDEAIEIYKKLLNNSKLKLNSQEQEQLYHGLANCYRDMKHYETAIALYNKLIDSNTEKREYLESKATCLYYQGDAYEAAKLYQQIINQNPNFFIAHLSLAQALGKIDINRAKQKFEEIIQQFPNQPNAYIVYGRFLQNNDCYEEAKKVYQLGLSKHRYNEKLIVGSAFFLLANDDVTEAIKQFTELMQTTAIHRDVYLGYALCLGRQGEWEEVIKILGPKQQELFAYKEILLCISIAYYSSGNLEAAEHHAQEALKIDSKYHSAWSQLAHIYGLKNDSKKAAEYFRKAYECQSDRLNYHRSPSQGIQSLVYSEHYQAVSPQMHVESQLRDMVSTFFRRPSFNPLRFEHHSTIPTVPKKSQSPLQVPDTQTTDQDDKNNSNLHDPVIKAQYDELLLKVGAKINLCQLDQDHGIYMHDMIYPLLEQADNHFQRHEYLIAFEKVNNAITLLDSKLKQSSVINKKLTTEYPLTKTKQRNIKKTKHFKTKKSYKKNNEDEDERLLQEAIKENKLQQQSNVFQRALETCCPCFFARKGQTQQPPNKFSQTSKKTL